MEFQRETATRTEDMPHRFSAIQRADACEVCSSGHDDARHVAWEKLAVATREHANQTMMEREFGS